MVDYFLEYFDDVNRITMLFYDKFDPLRIEARGLPLNTALSSKLTNDPTIKSVLRQ